MRPGWLATEFWLTAAVVIGTLTASHDFFSDHWSAPWSMTAKGAVLIMMAFGMSNCVVNYTTSRFRLKCQPGVECPGAAEPARQIGFGRFVQSESHDEGIQEKILRSEA
jgi:hypothetical protein